MLSGYWNGGVGCSIETLAELLGDTPKVAFDHYGKEWGQHYQAPLWAAIGESTVTQPAATAPPAPVNAPRMLKNGGAETVASMNASEEPSTVAARVSVRR